MPGLEFRVLGPLQVLRNREPLPLTAPKQRALLSLLLLRPNAPISQDELIDALWKGQPPKTARAAFQNLIHALRQLVGSDTLLRTPGGYSLQTEPEAIDLERFRRLSAEASHLRALERAARLRQALAMWRGSAFGDLSGDPSAQAEIVRLDDERLGTLEDRIDADLELGGHAVLVPELQQLVVQQPLRERLWFQLLLALYRSGRQADALATYRRAHDTLVGGLGIEPGIVLQELQRAILIHDRALDDPRRVLGSTLERAAAILPYEPRERAESLLEYGEALIRLGEFRHAASTVQAAERLSRAAGERGLEERARVLLSYLGVFADGESMTVHLRVAVHAARVFERLGDEAGLAFALSHEAHMHRDTGHAELALAFAERSAEIAARAGDLAQEAASRRMAAQCAALGPTPVGDALAICDAAEAARDDTRRLSVWDARAWLLAQSGRISEARGLYERELAEARERGVFLKLMVGMARAALAERVAGDLDRAAELFHTAYALARADDMRGDMPGVAGELACVLALRGDVGEARHLGEESRSGSVPSDVLGETLWRRALALVAAHEGRNDEAVHLSGDAHALAEQTDWLTFRGETLEEAALVHRLCGDGQEERQALEQALAVYERKGNVVGAARVRMELAKIDPS